MIFTKHTKKSKIDLIIADNGEVIIDKDNVEVARFDNNIIAYLYDFLIDFIATNESLVGERRRNEALLVLKERLNLYKETK